MHGFGGAIDDNATRLMVKHIISSFQSSVWFTSQLSQVCHGPSVDPLPVQLPTSDADSALPSQIHLNHRSKTFAGSYGITAYLLFGSIVLSHVSSLFSRWLGRSQVMQPFTMWDVMTIVVQGVLVVQARKLPRVVQEDDGGS